MDIKYLPQDLGDQVHTSWFVYHFVELAAECLLDLALLNISSDCQDVGLWQLLLVNQLSNPNAGFVPVHVWHLAIRNNQPISNFRPLNHLNGNLAIVCFVQVTVED